MGPRANFRTPHSYSSTYALWMARGLRWLLLFCVALVLTALFQPFLDHALEKIGLFTAPGAAVTTALNWLEMLVGVTAFPWIAGGVLGRAAGAWFDAIMRRLDGRYPVGKKARAKALFEDLETLALRIDHATREPYLDRQVFPSLFSEVEIATTTLDRLGFEQLVDPERLTHPLQRSSSSSRLSCG